MFAWLTHWLQDLAIDRAFVAAEGAARLAHQQDAQARFPSAALESQVADLRAQIAAEAEARFSPDTRSLDALLCELRQGIATLKGDLAILRRDFRAELAPLYDEIHANKAALTDLYADKDSAYQDLMEAKGSLDRWYGKSERTYCFGNGGRQLPRHAIFSQSLGDRDSYKATRDEAYETVAACREEIAALMDQNQSLSRCIQEVKVARQRAFDLRQAGRNAVEMERMLGSLGATLGTVTAKRGRLGQARQDYLHAVKEARGLATLEARLADLCRERAAFIAVFDTPAALTERQRWHREHWLQQHR